MLLQWKDGSNGQDAMIYLKGIPAGSCLNTSVESKHTYIWPVSSKVQLILHNKQSEDIVVLTFLNGASSMASMSRSSAIVLPVWK